MKTAEQQEVKKQSIIDYILDYMEKEFSGDLQETARKAANKVQAENLTEFIFQEIGPKALQEEFRQHRLISYRLTEDYKPPNPKGSGVQRIKKKKTGGFTRAYYDPSRQRWFDLMEFDKTGLLAAADMFDKKAKGNEKQKQFMLKLSEKLTGKKKVKEVYSNDEVASLESKIFSK